jgi:hypothetical protein
MLIFVIRLDDSLHQIMTHHFSGTAQLEANQAGSRSYPWIAREQLLLDWIRDRALLVPSPLGLQLFLGLPTVDREYALRAAFE